MNSQTILSRLALGAVAVSAAEAGGAIVVFDINPDVTRSDFSYTFGGVGVSSVNLSNGTFVQGAAGSAQLFSVGTTYGRVGFTYGPAYAVDAVGAQQGFVLSMIAAGQSIGSASSFVNDSNLSTYTYFDQGAGTRYIGLRLNQSSQTYYGWFEFSYTPLVSGFRDFTFTRFAFNDIAGQSILAGQTAAVPEASTLGLVGGLFGLVAAAHVRRRRQQQAAASDKFLALAAGEKLG